LYLSKEDETMKNIELIKNLEQDDNGFTIDYNINKDDKTLYVSYDTYHILKHGFTTKYLNTNDYTDINTIDINTMKLSQLTNPIRRWLNEEAKTDEFGDEIVKIGHITLNNVKYQYQISINH